MALSLTRLRKPRKLGNEPIIVDGVRFDSKGEARCWAELRLLERAGEISELKRQVRISLIGQHNNPITYDSGRQAAMVIDFSFIRRGETLVTHADFKGLETDESKLKRAIVMAMYGRPVVVMRAPASRRR